MAPVSDSWGGHPRDSDLGLSDHTGDSDNSNSFRHHSDSTYRRNIDLLGRASNTVTVEVHGRVRILIETFCVRIHWVNLGEPHMIHSDRCFNNSHEPWIF